MSGDFIIDQILGMKWLNQWIGHALNAVGINIEGKIGGSLQFFLYDVVKIAILLCVLIYLISYIQSYFPPERSKKIMGKFQRNMGQYYGRTAWYGHTVLQLFVHSIII